LGPNIPFRSTQAQANTIDTWAATVDGGVGTLTITDFQIDRDVFGIAKLNRTIAGGCEWFSTAWHNGVLRHLSGGGADPYDSYTIARGNGAVSVKGDGTAIMSGPDPRIYVEGCRFQNVELTMYSRRSATGTPPSHAGLVAGVRSDHQLVTPTNDPCFGTGLYGRLHYSAGRATIIKELAHLGSDAGYTPERSRSAALSWDGSSTIGTAKFYGYKLVVRNTSNNGGVKVSLYRDLTEGFNGGQWEHVLTYTDAGGWSARTDVSSMCGIPNDKVLRNSGSAVFLRNSGIAETPYRWFSVREISPE
jgi:hypothetical protein